mmetsp:Transcript_17500/g.22287  ORF Transcript_17500/g.22287 Transcript_17500/m.22287 type:complete len:825 (-) Transcript_17500:108-2582(-)|eukprot:CAMPEP_0204871346 /NCGR_PEP_ID=MMETSP1348-20121228/35064_1 /ASSEMBLY_ACC=CAM_ASM_000700 /TAXON_ID=215587 /ORGANISM="Aplanochytrium stocchinoi, Strain GSBS06" /LENGTH=824 /DNA_ID=CAMNT_0052025571 /DNA_START=298 /DNA_END=2772 /DNA_ORIENTATION=-
MSVTGNYFDEHPKIHYTDYPWNGASSLSTALGRLAMGVKCLSVDRVKLTPSEGEMLARSLAVNKTCEGIFLNQNNMGDENDLAAVAFAEALRQNTTLVYFCLQSTRIGLKGVQALTDALKYNTSVLSFNLHGCKMPKEGLPYFLDMFQYNKSILRMNLYDNALRSADNYKEVESMMERNKHVRAQAKKHYRAAFEYAIKYGEKGPWKRAKLMVIGQGRAGKSATVRSLLGEKFDPNGESTVGISLSRTNVRGDEWIKDVARTADFSTTVATRLAIQYRNKNDFLPASDIQIPRSEEVKGEGGENGDGPVNVPEKDTVADKEEVAHKFESSLRIFGNEVLTKNDDYIDFTIWDYGGQKVFYALHHLFLTEYGVYLLAFDMREILVDQKNSLEYLRFWLNSVRLHAPLAPVLLVGTFGDQVIGEEMLKVNEHINKLTSRFTQIVPNDSTGTALMFFPIDNTGGSGSGDVELIRNSINDVTKNQEFVHRETPIRWLRTLDKLNEDATRSWYTLTEVRNMSKKCGISSVSEVSKMLSLFHKLGVIVHLTNTAALENTITTNPQWLIDSLSKVIRSANLHGFNMEDLDVAGLRNEAEDLLNDALASRDLLEYLWQDKHKQVDFLIDLMRETLLISDWNFGNSRHREGLNVMYLVPSMLEEVKADKVDKPGMNGWNMKVDFSESWLPIGVFQRLICSCITLCENMNRRETEERVPELSKSSAKIWSGSEGFIYIEQNPEKDYIEIIFENDDVVSKSFVGVMSMLNYLNERLMNNGLKWTTHLRTGSHPGNVCQFVPYEVARKKKMYPWFTSGGEGTTSVVQNMDLDNFLA